AEYSWRYSQFQRAEKSSIWILQGKRYSEGKEDQEKTGVRIMGKITLKLPGEKDFFTQEAFKVLRTNLQFCGQDVQVISITSCDENEGKTTVSLQLARSLAELGKNMLI